MELIEWFNNFLSNPSPLLAVLFGLSLSFGGTQIIKRNAKLVRRWFADLDDDTHRTVIRLIAFLLAWVPVALLWPVPENATLSAGLTIKFLAAGVTATCAPYIYKLFSLILFHFWPWLEPKMSARPRTEDEP